MDEQVVHHVEHEQRAHAVVGKRSHISVKNRTNSPLGWPNQDPAKGSSVVANAAPTIGAALCPSLVFAHMPRPRLLGVRRVTAQGRSAGRGRLETPSQV